MGLSASHTGRGHAAASYSKEGAAEASLSHLPHLHLGNLEELNPFQVSVPLPPLTKGEAW